MIQGDFEICFCPQYPTHNAKLSLITWDGVKITGQNE